jgi:pyridoxal 5'-phosphate synthase pdxS subunit
MREVTGHIRKIQNMPEEQLMGEAKEMGAPYNLVKETAKLGRLPVVNFAAGGIATPADASIMMQLGADGLFVGSGIFKSENPPERAKAIVLATTNYDDPKILAEVSKGIGDPMKGIDVKSLSPEELLQTRGV